MMPRILLADPAKWTIHNLHQLVTEKVPEGQRIEYKETLKLDTKSQKVEVAKDVSGMANAQGGWLIFGVSEDDESAEPLPQAITPIAEGGLQTRLENILDSALEPIPAYQVSTIQDGEGVVLVARVSKTSGRPIMVQGYEQNRYFVRAGTRTRPMNATEVAQAHSDAERSAERVIERLQGLPLIATIAPGFRPISLGRMDTMPVVSVVVAVTDGSAEPIGSERISKHAFEESLDGYRAQRPVRRDGVWTINSYGLSEETRMPPPPADSGPLGLPLEPAVDPGDDRLVVRRLAIYRTGVIESARRYEREQIIPFRSMADDIHNALLYAARVFEEVGYVGQLVAWVRVDHAAEAILDTPHEWDRARRPPGVDELTTSRKVTTDELLADPTTTVQATLDLIWQGFGFERCLLFDAEGHWNE